MHYSSCIRNSTGKPKVSHRDDSCPSNHTHVYTLPWNYFIVTSSVHIKHPNQFRMVGFSTLRILAQYSVITWMGKEFGKGYVCVQNWITLLRTWNHHSVGQLWWWRWFSRSVVSNSCDPVDWESKHGFGRKDESWTLTERKPTPLGLASGLPWRLSW